MIVIQKEETEVMRITSQRKQDFNQQWSEDAPAISSSIPRDSADVRNHLRVAMTPVTPDLAAELVYVPVFILCELSY